MAIKKAPATKEVYTEEDRRRWCYRTAAEMRIIIDRAERRSQNDAQREENEGTEEKTKMNIFS